jgi:hypothetical protein
MSKVQKALSDEHWAEFLALEPGTWARESYGDDWAEGAALVALLMHGQPFGFTWEDVDAIRNAANALHASPAFGLLATPEKLFRVAERIEALLPPRS